MQSGYARSLKWGMEHKPVIMGLFALSLIATVVMFMNMKTDFIPSEDTGQINVNTEAADRTSFDQMVQISAAAGESSPRAIPISRT